MHSRQSRNTSHKEPEAIEVDIEDWQSSDVLYNSLIRPRNQYLRDRWVEVILKKLNSKKLVVEDCEEKISEIFKLCLSEGNDQAVVAIVHCLVHVLGKSNLLYEISIPSLIEYASRKKQHLPLLMICLALYDDIKNIEYILSKYIGPTMEEGLADIHTVPSESDADGAGVEQDIRANNIIGSIEAWQFGITFCTPEKIVECIGVMFPILIELIEYPLCHVRTVAASCVLSIADIIESRGLKTDVDLEETKKAINRVLYSPKFDWNNDSKVAMENLLEAFNDEVYLVTVPGMHLPISGSGDQRRDLIANINKKGNPVTGYSEAFVVGYTRVHLGHGFSLNMDMNVKGSKGDFTDFIISVITRHPASRNFALHANTIRTYKGRYKQFLSRKIKEGKQLHKKIRKDKSAYGYDIDQE